MVRKVEKTELNASRCICLDCPSYTTGCKIKNIMQTNTRSTGVLQNKTHYEKMFCAFEKSNCIHLNKGCLCENCTNYHDYDLKRQNWCLHPSE